MRRDDLEKLVFEMIAERAVKVAEALASYKERNPTTTLFAEPSTSKRLGRDEMDKLVAERIAERTLQDAEAIASYKERNPTTTLFAEPRPTATRPLTQKEVSEKLNAAIEERRREDAEMSYRK